MTNGSHESSEWTTARVRKATVARLEARKDHERDTLDEVLEKLLDMTEKPKRVPGPRNAMEAEA